ncbi:N-(5'-phosphoribosyl)anthranilate isomerase [Burkholderia pseudomallei]|nr:N-(5'-phosphoribosyl)anthranilate isomerase [Burkholderia pseudomallei]CAJ3048791.1 N-(5'-phosphoribosyl)anthranilate isomerase [Burkholderia pseudomallei]CAJ3111821.1 N-(5'-phosphoribosyl)anthranilate isomerase [Burkholderia pseudomallei]CAJ3119785.1 N-(5'-phosphoribosyl)anthranilate isomerase [Burkholderia pseudomallei]CAJ3495540.1 N-(5'-phosphoribosyl)anthranilate isomerase [Burkholderia pseudomallei]
MMTDTPDATLPADAPPNDAPAAGARRDTGGDGRRDAPPPRTRIKLCGLSNAADIDWAAELGADAIGLVFYPKSPRAVTLEQAAALAARVPPFVSVVGLFVNPTEDEIARVANEVPLTLLQFHGDETPGQCASLAAAARLPWLRALRVGVATQPADLVESALHYSAARGLLFDTLVEHYGGSGKVFDWSLIPAELARRAVLSGGLNAQNVGDAIRQVRPFAVDVSSGIEAPGAKGVKDRARMAAFVRAVREADAG